MHRIRTISAFTSVFGAAVVVAAVDHARAVEPPAELKMLLGPDVAKRQPGPLQGAALDLTAVDADG